jgi:hypothetical protein
MVPDTKTTLKDPERLRTDLKDDLIDHLSNEIRTLSGYIVAFRTRIAFTVLIGPFTILLAMVALSKDVKIFPMTLSNSWVVLVILLGVTQLVNFRSVRKSVHRA